MKEVTLTGTELEVALNDLLDKRAGTEITTEKGTTLTLPVPAYKVRTKGADALVDSIIKIAEAYQKAHSDKIGKLTFKSIDFNLAGFIDAEQNYMNALEARINEFKKDAEHAHDMGDFSNKLKRAIFNKARESAGSNNYSEIYSAYGDFVDIAEIALGLH